MKVNWSHVRTMSGVCQADIYIYICIYIPNIHRIVCWTDAMNKMMIEVNLPHVGNVAWIHVERARHMPC